LSCVLARHRTLDYMFAGYPCGANGDLAMNNHRLWNNASGIHQNEEPIHTRGTVIEAPTYINPPHGGLGMKLSVYYLGYFL
jgi:hypothetical protein